jgi:serine/threonine protein phosphatase PrpC
MSGSNELGRDQIEEKVVQNVGCTANLILITETEIYCANAGDCRCVLAVKQGDKMIAKDLSVDHKPNLESEMKRIEKAGGFVKANRVDGGLNLGRSLGDLFYKLDPKLP